MPRVISLNARAELQAGRSSAVPILLVTITHPSLTAPIRLSTDPTERFSVEPLVYGTRSGGNQYLFVLLSAILPDDMPNTSPQTTLALANIDSGLSASLRSITSPCWVDLTVVLASAPDDILEQYTGLRGRRGSSNAAQVSLEISREPFTSEPCPAGRMTKQRFPTLFV